MTTLYYSIAQFFERKMSEHSLVQQYVRNLTVPNEYIYDISRKDALPDVRVWLSDAYRFGIADYFGRPSCIRRGDFILIARPEATFIMSEQAAKDSVGIGKIGYFMGALNYRVPGDYRGSKQQR